MSRLPRGIAPDLLLSQVRNTMPYLFDSGVDSGVESEVDADVHSETDRTLGRFFPSQVLREFAQDPTQPLTHFEYFRLCLSSHYLTCATPVPTDVDNQIRKKLWPAELPLEIALQMTDLILESRHWDFTLVSSRFTYGKAEWQDQALDGHLGEWFTVSAAAYCALQNYSDPLALEKRQEIFSNIQEEIHRHSEIFGSLWRANEGVACLKTAANIAHNFGDLDRVMDMWDLSVGDPLRLNFYKLTASPYDSDRKLRYLGRLWVAGELYKSPNNGSSMALENHRHFALRKPRCLRKSSSLLIPNGPFFDNWGNRLAQQLSGDDLLEVVTALKYGWERLPKTIGYGRALLGIIEILPELAIDSAPRCSKDLFEKQWGDEALRLMEEIPSKA